MDKKTSNPANCKGQLALTMCGKRRLRRIVRSQQRQTLAQITTQLNNGGSRIVIKKIFHKINSNQSAVVALWLRSHARGRVTSSSLERLNTRRVESLMYVKSVEDLSPPSGVEVRRGDASSDNVFVI
ncbi:hypothetical protein TNCV_3043421 [Trichonephila clavipes]|nr:hypothetical protein TNCV_3043421 [Trichonephila clavipes]